MYKCGCGQSYDNETDLFFHQDEHYFLKTQGRGIFETEQQIPQGDRAKILFRFWNLHAERLAMWKIYYDGRYEYHVTTARGVTRYEDFDLGCALARAGFQKKRPPLPPPAS